MFLAISIPIIEFDARLRDIFGNERGEEESSEDDDEMGPSTAQLLRAQREAGAMSSALEENGDHDINLLNEERLTSRIQKSYGANPRPLENETDADQLDNDRSDHNLMSEEDEDEDRRLLPIPGGSGRSDPFFDDMVRFAASKTPAPPDRSRLSFSFLSFTAPDLACRCSSPPAARDPVAPTKITKPKPRPIARLKNPPSADADASDAENCAINPDGTLKDAKEIRFFNSPSDEHAIGESSPGQGQTRTPPLTLQKEAQHPRPPTSSTALQRNPKQAPPLPKTTPAVTKRPPKKRARVQAQQTGPLRWSTRR